MNVRSQCAGHVREVVDGEVTLEMSSRETCPTDVNTGFCVEMVWKSTRYASVSVSVSVCDYYYPSFLLSELCVTSCIAHDPF